VHLIISTRVLIAERETKLRVPLVVGGALTGPDTAWVVDVCHAPRRLLFSRNDFTKPSLSISDTLEVRQFLSAEMQMRDPVRSAKHLTCFQDHLHYMLVAVILCCLFRQVAENKYIQDLSFRI